MRVARKISTVLAGILAFAFGIATMQSVWAAEWLIETVDQSGSGQFASIQVDKLGNVHVAYVPDVDGHPLKYAYRDHVSQKWFTMTVTQVASFCTLALDSKQHPYISFADHGTGLGARLRYAHWDGNAWKVTPITIQPGAVVAYYTGIALDAQDNPFFSYYDYADPGNNFRLRMRSVFWVGDHFEARTVDAHGGSGTVNAAAFDSAGRPQIAYANVKYETSGLRYAAWNGSAWKTEIIEGAAGPVPVFSVGMVLDKNDTPHIAYSLTETGAVKYATKVNGKWVTQALDSVKQVAYPDRNGIVLDSDGNPYISYFDAKQGMLKVAHRQDGKWIAEVLDDNYSGFTNSLAIGQDTLWAAYADDLGKGLKVAHRPLRQTVSLSGAPGPKAAENTNPARFR
jgi:hypothetical protein